MRTWVSVPYPCPDGFPTIPARERIGPIARSFRDLIPAMSKPEMTLDIVGTSPKPLSPDDFPAILVTRNERRFLPSFLRHYRSLGVTRFIIVDDQSTDDTRSYLAEQGDVDCYASNVRFAAAFRGRIWRQMLVRRYGMNRWYLSVDADEYLVYSAHEKKTLRELTQQLESIGVWHMAAPMLDLYPGGNVADASFDGSTEAMPWHVANLFDAKGYVLSGDERSWKIRGGLRRRCFGVDPELIKYPLVYWSRLTNLNKAVHFAGPYWRNFAPPFAALLHFKFLADYFNQFQAVVANAQHFDGGAIYRGMLDKIGDPDRLNLATLDVSAPFVGAEDLLARGFFVGLNPEKAL